MAKAYGASKNTYQITRDAEFEAGKVPVTYTREDPGAVGRLFKAGKLVETTVNLAGETVPAQVKKGGFFGYDQISVNLGGESYNVVLRNLNFGRNGREGPYQMVLGVTKKGGNGEFIYGPELVRKITGSLPADQWDQFKVADPQVGMQAQANYGGVRISDSQPMPGIPDPKKIKAERNERRTKRFRDLIYPHMDDGGTTPGEARPK